MNTQSPLMNFDEAVFEPWPLAAALDADSASFYEARVAAVAQRIGARQLGCSILSVPPGKSAFPFHNHHRNEEMFVVLRGRGALRLGSATHSVRAGDIIACPAGGPESAHKITNTGNLDLVYLAISTKGSPEVVEYPDSGKFGLLSESSGMDGRVNRFTFVGRTEMAVPYFEGEARRTA